MRRWPQEAGEQGEERCLITDNRHRVRLPEPRHRRKGEARRGHYGRAGRFIAEPAQNEFVHVRLDGRMAELPTLIDPKLYRPNVVMEHGNPVLYARLQKTLYGILQSSLRLWEQVLDDLTKFGFTINP